MENEKNENNDSQNVEELETQEESQEETPEESNELEESLEEESDDSEDEITLEDFNEAKAKLKELEEKNKQLYARLKKNERLPKKEIKEIKEIGSDEEKILQLAKLANTLDEDDLEALKTVIGSSLEEKVNNPLFKAYKAQKDKKKRSEASALKPSISGSRISGKSFNDPNLSAEEHKKLWEKGFGK